MIVAVTGGRSFVDIGLVRDVLTKLRPRPELLLHGGATGADSLCVTVAEELGIPTKHYAADWNTHGRSAGPIRNQAMVNRKPNLLIAFKGGKGTDDMIRRAQAAKINILYVGVVSS